MNAHSTPDDALEGLLARTVAALEAGDAGRAAAALASALGRIAAGPPPRESARLQAIVDRGIQLAECEAARLAGELAQLGSSRRAADRYRGA